MNKKKIFALIMIPGVIVVIGIAAFFGSMHASEFDRKVNELKNRRMHARLSPFLSKFGS